MESIRFSTDTPEQARESSSKRSYSPPTFTEVGDAVQHTTGVGSRYLEGFNGWEGSVTSPRGS